MYDYAIRRSNIHLSPYTELIESLIGIEITPRAFSRTFEKLFLSTDFMLPKATQEVIARLYQLARDWDDPDATFRTSEANLLMEAKNIIDALNEFEGSAWQDQRVVITWAESFSRDKWSGSVDS